MEKGNIPTNSDIQLNTEQKQYINYNLKCFFDHYGLDQKIIKIKADCIILKKMTKDVSSFLDFLKKYPQYQTSQHSRNKIHTIPLKQSNLSTANSFEKKAHSNLPSARIQTNKKRITKPKIERALTCDDKNDTETKKRMLSKSPTQKPKTTTSKPTSFSKGKSVRNFKTVQVNKSGDLSQTLSSLTHKSLKSSQVGKDNIGKINIHTKTNTNIHAGRAATSSPNLTKEKSKGNLSTVSGNSTSKTKPVTPNKKLNTPKKVLTPRKTPIRNKGTPKTNNSTNNSTINKNKDKKPINLKSGYKAKSPVNTFKIGNFKDEANRSISPIDNSFEKAKKYNATIHEKLEKKTFPQNKIAKIVQKKIPKISKPPKEITLNTSTENIESDDLNSEREISEGILQAQKNKEINTVINSRIEFSSPQIEALYLTLKSNFLSENQKISIIFKNPELYKNFSKKILLKELISSYETKFINCSEFLSKYDLNHINKPFIPTKTAQNGLKFITKEEENYLLKKEQPKEIINIFILIFILLNEEYENIPPEQIISYLINEIYKKYNVDSIRALFINYIVKNTQNLNQKQINSLAKIIKDNPNLLSSSEIMKIHSTLSYMTFILKELVNYIFQKTDDGTYFYIIREANIELNLLGEKIKKLKLYL